MLIPSIATLSIAYFGMKRADPYIDELSKQRLFFLRGGQAEGLIAWLLEDLDDNWHIFNGIKLDPESDIDHVLLGPAGIFCISTKSMRGLFSRTPSGLLHNGNSCEYDRQVLAQSAELKKKLDVVMGTPVRWVQAVLAVPFGFTQGDSMGNKYWLVHQENLLQTIAPDPLPKYRRNLDSQQIERIAKALEMLQVSAADVYERPKIPVK